MDNLLAWGLSSLREGHFAMPIPPDVKLQQIAVSDIGAFAVLAIEHSHRFEGMAIDIASDELSGEEASSILSRVTGREITYSRTPLEAIRKVSDDMATMYEWFERVGYNVDIETLHRENRAVPWHTFQGWAMEQDWKTLLGLTPQPRPSQRKVAQHSKSPPV
jgi:hypothetical protein